MFCVWFEFDYLSDLLSVDKRRYNYHHHQLNVPRFYLELELIDNCHMSQFLSIPDQV